MSSLPFRYSLGLLLLAAAGGASAIGLGPLRGQPALGQPLRLEIDLFGVDKVPPEATCFRLVEPHAAAGQPWLKKATLTVRRGPATVLEIRSDLVLREPLLYLGVQLGCGHEITREYVVLASPSGDVEPPVAEPAGTSLAPAPARSGGAAAPRRRARPAALPDAPAHLTPRQPMARLAPVIANPTGDRLVVGGGAEGGLRLATELGGGKEMAEAQRDLLRLEFRMLMTLNEQATTQLAASEKLRNAEGTLNELQQRAGELAQRSEQEMQKPLPQVAAAPAPAPVQAVAPAVDEGLADWGLYGALGGVGLTLLGWIGWRNFRRRQDRGESGAPVVDEPKLASPAKAAPLAKEKPAAKAVVAEPPLAAVSAKPAAPAASAAAALDLPLEPALPAKAAVDVELDPVKPVVAVRPQGAQPASSTSLEEHFDANPVMELADIMLSFGRVKGAAQALQEYIDCNPQEALQPWIRLMDVYRMAGMRAEFEAVAQNLNRNFNVAVQRWEDEPGKPPPPAEGEMVDGRQRPQSLEDMPHIMDSIIELWPSPDIVEYLHQLLRDNRGGQRLGFALSTVEEILFLIEVKDASIRQD